MPTQFPRALLQALVLVLPGIAAAQAPTAPRAVDVVGPQFIALSVPDLDASIRWYREVFGLEQVFADGAPDGSARVVLLASDVLRVELGAFRAARSLREVAGQELPPMLVHGIVKFGFFVRDIAQTAATLRARGVTIEGEWLTRPSHLAPGDPLWTPNLLARDNSGNYLQFFQRGP